MSASDHIGNQFTTVYRGLSGVTHPSEIDSELIGPHWTKNHSIALNFAGETGSVVTGKVPNEHILYDYETGQHHPDLKKYTFDNDAVHRVMPDPGIQKTEHETFVRPGVPISITDMETHPSNPIRDKWSFNPPLTRSSTKLSAYTAEKDGGDITKWHKGES